MQDDFVPEEVAQARFERLVALQSAIGQTRNARHLGSVMEVLVEGPSKKRSDVATTRTRGNIVAHVEGSFEPGSFLDIEIIDTAKHYLVGRPV